MRPLQSSVRLLHISLWLVQIVLASSLIWAAYLKLFSPTAQLAAMWPWTAQLPKAFVNLTALLDGLGAIGLVLPSLLNVRPRVTSLAAVGIIGLMIGAIVLHLSRGEASLIGVNLVFMGLAAFVAWGRAT
ncbi:DoxX family protein [Spirosoma sp. 209]|uniref:DoxX family protein n=1 Tax=Spirosoma sp. 209 TaxID=1955701 RepID=UPI00098D44FD|nr:DoxX family protein [Spirosoma sp. 209]